MARTAGARLVARLATVALITGVLSLGAPAALAASEPRFNPPKQFYLALGDSTAFGFQFGKFQQEIATHTYNPASFNTGYVDDFAAKMRDIRPTLQVVNVSCPGETTATLIAGNCPFHNASLPLALHSDYPITTPQLTAAIDFLRAHDGKVGPITISIGGNDIQNLFLSTCHRDLACTQARLPGVLADVRANVDHILSELRAESPSSEIILLTTFNPYIVVVGAPSASIVQALNATEASVAAEHRVRVADGYTPLSTPAEICALTFMCTQGDIHPNDAGYAVMANALWAASGYAALDQRD